MTHEYTIHDAAVEKPESEAFFKGVSVDVLALRGKDWFICWYDFVNKAWKRYGDYYDKDFIPTHWTELPPPPLKPKVWVKKTTLVAADTDGNLYPTTKGSIPFNARNLTLTYEQEEDQP